MQPSGKLSLKCFIEDFLASVAELPLAQSLSPAVAARLEATAVYVQKMELKSGSTERFVFVVDLLCFAPVNGTVLVALLSLFEKLPCVERVDFRLSFPDEVRSDLSCQLRHTEALLEWFGALLRRRGKASLALALESAECSICAGRLRLSCPDFEYELLRKGSLENLQNMVKECLGFCPPMELIKSGQGQGTASFSEGLWDAAAQRRVDALLEDAETMHRRKASNACCSHGHTHGAAGEAGRHDSRAEAMQQLSQRLGAERRDKMYDHGRNRWQKVGSDDVLWGRYPKEERFFKISDINMDCGTVVITGLADRLETRAVKNGKSYLYSFSVYSEEGSIRATFFVDAERTDELAEFRPKRYYHFFVQPVIDRYTNDVQVRVQGIKRAAAPPQREDNAEVKRIELHCHTQMSTRDALSDIEQLVRLAADFGHKALAITDHGVVQAFPQAKSVQRALAKEGKNIDLLFGMEGYLVEDGVTAVYGPDMNVKIGEDWVLLHLVTSGSDPATDEILKITACRYVCREGGDDYVRKDSFFSYAKPRTMPSADCLRKLGIDKNVLDAAEGVHEVVLNFARYLGASCLVAAEALEVLAFLRYEGCRVSGKGQARLKFNPVTVDLSVLEMLIRSRRAVEQRGQEEVSAAPEAGPLLPVGEVAPSVSDRLNYAKALSFAVAERCFVKRGEEQRLLDLYSETSGERDLTADREAELTERLSLVFCLIGKELGSLRGEELNRLCGKLDLSEIRNKKNRANHIIFLARDELGLYNLYRLVSESNIHYFQFRPRCPRSLLRYFRAGITVGSACEAGELFRSVLELYQQHGSDYSSALSALESSRLWNMADFYDYLEIQPLGNNAFLLRKENNGIETTKDLEALNRLIVELAKKKNKPFVATCDSHFLEKSDGKYRSVLLDGNGLADADAEVPLYFRTTEEMFSEFLYLSEEDRRRAILEYPARIAAEIDGQLEPFPAGSYPPEIPGAPKDVRDMVYAEAERLYAFEGKLPAIVAARVERELKAIIDNGFSIMYYIAHHLVKRSNEDGYLVGSRGSVGSSLVATFCRITEVNPLPPHYRCPSCRYSEFDESGNYGSGYDLPEKGCPHCGTPMVHDGQDIPFETFLGFDGDKQPDIDLNFSGDYQMQAHEFIRAMFGREFTFRAGTVSAYQEKNCIALVRKYAEKRGLTIHPCEQERMAAHLEGVTSTTGQHPGGIVVIPKERDIYDFTPIQFPANKLDSPFCTTHYDFNSLHDTILKLDILGHDDPTMLRVLSDLTGKDILEIPVPDPEVMKLFTGTESLQIETGTGPSKIGSLGLPEMGTFMARGMIEDIKPQRFYDLVQLLGLSHGTDVWKGNAQDLILNGTCSINDVIGCRDSIMTTLIYWGLPKKASFDIMEKVRKGKGLSEEQEMLMRQNKVPDWYIDSCKKIKYMFPKAHAVAYAISALRIAWFKVHLPEAWYCAWFSIRSKVFKAQKMCRPLRSILNEMESLKNSGKMASDKNFEKEYYCYEIVQEMYLRGITFDEIDLNLSQANLFSFDQKGKVRPSLDSIDGISESMARNIVRAREEAPFRSKEDLLRRADLTKPAMETLEELGLLKNLPESNQVDMMSLLGGNFSF